MNTLHAIVKAACVVVASCAASLATAGGCSLNSSGLSFGSYQPLSFPGQAFSGDTTTDGSVALVCSGIVTGGTYTVALGGSPVDNGMSPRLMINSLGGPSMQFNVYRDPGFSMVWGDGTTGGVFSGMIAPGDSSTTFTAYGKVPAGQTGLRVGRFTATLVMTLTYNP